MAWPTEAGSIATALEPPRRGPRGPRRDFVSSPAAMPWLTAAGAIAAALDVPRSGARRDLRRAPSPFIFDPSSIAGVFKSGADALRFYYSGAASDGADQASESDNLGGYRSSTEVASLGVQGALEDITIERVASPGPGVASIESDGAERLRYVAPGSVTLGPWVKVLPGAEALLEDGDDRARALRVSRADGAGAAPLVARELTFVDVYNNALGLDNVSHAERAAGDDEYRALILKNQGISAVDLAIFLSELGTGAALDASGYAASGAVAVGTGDTFADWPDSGYVENENTGEVLYYASRTSSALTVPAAGRDVYTDVAGGAAGSSGDSLISIPGLRLAIETPNTQPAGYIQTIADEDTAPGGRTWYHPHDADGPDVIEVSLPSGHMLGLWLHRTVIAGAAAVARARNDLVIESLTG